MADNLDLTGGDGTGGTLASNETTIDATVVQVQRVSTGAAPSVAHDSVSVDTTADLVLAANSDRKGVVVKPVDGTIYIGGSGVTTANGFRLDVGESFASSAFIGAIYAITASGTVDVRYWEES